MKQAIIDFEEPQVQRVLLGFGGTLCMNPPHVFKNYSTKQINESCSSNDVNCSLTKALDSWRLPPELKKLQPLELLADFEQKCSQTIKNTLKNPDIGVLNTQHITTKAGLFPDTKGKMCAIIHITGAHLFLHQWQTLQNCWHQDLEQQIGSTSTGISPIPNFWISKSFDQWALHDLGTVHNPYAKVLEKQYSKNFN